MITYIKELKTVRENAIDISLLSKKKEVIDMDYF